jgi:hypothetical protein
VVQTSIESKGKAHLERTHTLNTINNTKNQTRASDDEMDLSNIGSLQKKLPTTKSPTSTPNQHQSPPLIAPLNQNTTTASPHNKNNNEAFHTTTASPHQLPLKQ